ncbi:MAG: hypothetical protein LBQ15_03240 [Clostridium sp.]|nr:hypothetical protein [Clostridium sp.]
MRRIDLFCLAALTAAAVALRLALFYFQSMDWLNYLSPWVEFIRAGGVEGSCRLYAGR